MTPATRFTYLLVSLGIPIHGVSGSDANARIDFKDEATREQRELARQQAASFDWSERPEKTVEQIETTDLPRLTTEQKQLILNKMMAEFLVSRPRLLESVASVRTR